MPNVAGFMADYRAATWDNPLDPSMRVWSWADENGERLPMILTEIREERFSNGVHLSAILSADRQRTGTASAVLREIVALADKHDVSISLAAKPFGRVENALSANQLITWYKKYGWVRDPGYAGKGSLIRYPNGKKPEPNLRAARVAERFMG